jgi:hypothetical protein
MLFSEGTGEGRHCDWSRLRLEPEEHAWIAGVIDWQRAR